MKKLLPIYGHIFPLHSILFDGTNKNAFAKSITLSQKFQDYHCSLFLKNSGIISIVNEFSNMAEIYRRIVTELKIEITNRREILRCSHSGSKVTLCFTKTHLSNFLIPVNSIPEFKTDNSIPGLISMVKNKFQNTF